MQTHSKCTSPYGLIYDKRCLKSLFPVELSIRVADTPVQGCSHFQTRRCGCVTQVPRVQSARRQTPISSPAWAACLACFTRSQEYHSEYRGDCRGPLCYLWRYCEPTTCLCVLDCSGFLEQQVIYRWQRNRSGGHPQQTSLLQRTIPDCLVRRAVSARPMSGPRYASWSTSPGD